MRFLDLKTDFAFKKVFGSEESKPLLMSFLNALLYSEGDVKITDLTIVDPYNIPMLKGMKDSFVDVKAILSDGTKVIIEMQVLWHEGFEKRVLYNAAKNYSIQLEKGEDYHLLNPIIALSIVDFIMFEESDKVITHFKLLEKEEFIDYTDDLELVFIELPKFTRALEALRDIKEQWIWFVKNSGSMEYIPTDLPDVIQDAFKTANEANLTREEQEWQYKKREFIMVQRSIVQSAEKFGMQKGLHEGLEKGLQQGLKQGLEQGLEQGIEQGLERGKMETACQLIHDFRLSVEEVAEKLGIPQETLRDYLRQCR